MADVVASSVARLRPNTRELTRIVRMTQRLFGVSITLPLRAWHGVRTWNVSPQGVG